MAEEYCGSTESFWKPHKISTGRDQPGNPKASTELHPGFAKVQSGIASETNPKTGKPYGKAAAGAILASKTRAASPAAKKANSRLKRVKG